MWMGNGLLLPLRLSLPATCCCWVAEYVLLHVPVWLGSGISHAGNGADAGCRQQEQQGRFIRLYAELPAWHVFRVPLTVSNGAERLR